MQETCPIPKRTQPEHEEAPVPANLQNVALATEVACCLAEIDQALQRAADDEKFRATQEFERLQYAYVHGSKSEMSVAGRDIRVWQAQYAHLGLKVHYCCGVPMLYEAKR